MMEKQSRWFPALLLVAALSSVRTQQEVRYFQAGGELRLQPPAGGNITGLSWKHGAFLVAEWMETQLPLTFYGRYRGRAALDTTTGELLIRDAGVNDTGEYTLELNGVIQERRYAARLLRELPTPLVRVDPRNCSDESYDCLLVCGGDTGGVTEVTEVTEVSYGWRVGGGRWEKWGREVRIHNNDSMQEVMNFTCRLENPLEVRESRATSNPFYLKPLDNNDIDLGFDWGRFNDIVFYISPCLVIIVVGYIMYRKRVALRRCFNRLIASRNNQPPPAAQSIGLLPASQSTSAAPSAAPASSSSSSPPSRKQRRKKPSEGNPE